MSNSRFLFLGNHAAVDFVNTRPVLSNGRVELIGSYADLVDWLVDAEQLTASEAAPARERWAQTRVGSAALTEAHALRDAIESIIENRRAGRLVDAGPFEVVNQVLGATFGRREVVRRKGRYEITTRLEPERPADLLLPIAESAADLLCAVDPALLRRCANPECVLYFLDVSKNHTRRWCSMSLCGNREKAAAHYRRLVDRKRSRRGRRPDQNE